MRFQKLNMLRNATLFRMAAIIYCALAFLGADGAGTIRVSTPELYTDAIGEISANGIGVIVVYLQSSGDQVSNFEIELFDVPRQRTIEKKLSDENGIMRFAVPAGSYRIYLRKTPEQKGTTSAQIAEIRIE